jgi:hypothetical protein
VRVAVTAYSRVDGVWCHTYAIAATRHTHSHESHRVGGRHRREIRRDNGIQGTPEGPLGTGRYASGTPSARVEGALADGIDLLSALQRLVVLSRRPGPPGSARLAP